MLVVAARHLAHRELIMIERRPPDTRLVRLRLTEPGAALFAALNPRFLKLEMIGRLVHGTVGAGCRPPLLVPATREWRWEAEFR